MDLDMEEELRRMHEEDPIESPHDDGDATTPRGTPDLLMEGLIREANAAASAGDRAGDRTETLPGTPKNTDRHSMMCPAPDQASARALAQSMGL